MNIGADVKIENLVECEAQRNVEGNTEVIFYGENETANIVIENVGEQGLKTLIEELNEVIN